MLADEGTPPGLAGTFRLIEQHIRIRDVHSRYGGARLEKSQEVDVVKYVNASIWRVAQVRHIQTVVAIRCHEQYLLFHVAAHAIAFQEDLRQENLRVYLPGNATRKQIAVVTMRDDREHVFRKAGDVTGGQSGRGRRSRRQRRECWWSQWGRRKGRSWWQRQWGRRW